MEKREFIIKSVKETRQLAANLAKEIATKPAKKAKALVLALEGELGAGKTTFVKGFAKALGVKEKISSPTFVLIKSYKLKTKDYKLLFHVDAYRLKDHQDLIPLGIKEILNDPQNFVLIEWSDRVEPILPRGYIRVHFDHIDETTRKITLQLSP